MTAAQRGTGGGSWVRDLPGPLYTAEHAGGLCPTCERPVLAALPDTTHPTCDPDWPELVALSRAATRGASK